ncbi:MAG: GNAT family N-acetyltransferase [Firmicutes bacterium]|nr:GNAT family N-acetyltransferase [Bacillota bacterium]
MANDSYLVENELIYFRRAKKDDNMEEIARLIYDTDPYIYPYWFDKNESKCVDFLKEEMLKDGFIFNYNNLYVAYDSTSNKIVGVICAIDKSVNLKYDYETLEKVDERYKTTIKKYIRPILDEVEKYDFQTMYIPNVCIDNNLRGKKIGSRLLGYFISQMEKAGFNKFALDCLLHNLQAKNLYHGLGFKEMKLMNGFTGDDSLIDVVCFLRKKGAYLPEEFNK